MRLFVAIDLGEELIDKLVSVQKKIGSRDYDLKLVEPENLHLTLKFLGEVDESRLGQVERLVSESLKGTHPFTLSLQGLGYFGSGSFMKVVWVGVYSGKDEFVRLTRSLESSLSAIRREEREPSPHLTIARVKSGSQALAHEILSMKDVKLGEVGVKEIKLKQSVLTPQGPIYSDVKTFILAGKNQADESG
jgi:2'-5' RNA ligase